MIDETMLLGLGVDQYKVKSQFGRPVHNTYLLLWTEGGIFALIGFASLLLIALSGVVYVGGRHRLEAATGFALAAMVVFIGFTTGHIYSRQSLLPLYLAMALVFAASAEAGARGRPAVPRGPAPPTPRLGPTGPVGHDGPVDRESLVS
jgi:O-antigen ligase